MPKNLTELLKQSYVYKPSTHFKYKTISLGRFKINVPYENPAQAKTLNQDLLKLLNTSAINWDDELLERFDNHANAYSYFLLGLLVAKDKNATEDQKSSAQLLILEYKKNYAYDPSHVEYQHVKYMCDRHDISISDVSVAPVPKEPPVVISETHTPIKKKPKKNKKPKNPVVEQDPVDIVIAVLDEKNFAYLSNAANRDEIHALIENAVGNNDYKEILNRARKKIADKAYHGGISNTDEFAIKTAILIDCELIKTQELPALLAAAIPYLPLQKKLDDSVNRTIIFNALTTIMRQFMPHQDNMLSAADLFMHPENHETFRTNILTMITVVEMYYNFNTNKQINIENYPFLKPIIENHTDLMVLIDKFSYYYTNTTDLKNKCQFLLNFFDQSRDWVELASASKRKTLSLMLRSLSQNIGIDKSTIKPEISKDEFNKRIDLKTNFMRLFQKPSAASHEAEQARYQIIRQFANMILPDSTVEVVIQHGTYSEMPSAKAAMTSAELSAHIDAMTQSTNGLKI